jgi:hypothetical protein
MVNNDIRAHSLRHLCAHKIGLDRNDEGPLELCAPYSTQANRPLREDSDRVADLHLATFRGGDSRGRNVCQ